MTQAPTPGPLSAQHEEAIAFNLCAVHGFEPDFVKTQRDFALAVIREYEVVCRARLAPTAPVEASGSEREHGPKCWGKTSISDEMMYCYCGSTDSPPGETREYPWSFYDALKVAGIEHASFCVNGVTVFGDRSAAKEAERWHHESVSVGTYWRPEVIRQRDLLSALALGGQKGDSETLRVLLDNLVIAQTLSKDIRQKATDEARSYLYDLRHTPQPSGETREGESLDDVARRLFASQYPDRDYDDLKDMVQIGWLRKAHEEIISSRPLALGGQQDRLAERIKYQVECSSANLIKFGSDKDMVAICLGHFNDLANEVAALSTTTPARAEAQDEGAAGEPVAWLVQREGKRDRLVNARQYNPTKPDYWISAEAMAEHTITPLYAHPSPTPAADDDRVRIAVEAYLEAVDASDALGHGPADLMEASLRAEEAALDELRQALAALKSEGK